MTSHLCLSFHTSVLNHTGDSPSLRAVGPGGCGVGGDEWMGGWVGGGGVEP